MINVKKLSFENLKKLSVQQRIEAIKTPGIGQVLMSALTPTQLAELFPRYYLMRQPDISGFLKALPTSVTAARLAQFQEQLNNTASGDAAGENMDADGWRRKLQEGVDEQTATPLKPGEVPQPKLSPEQTAVIESLQKGENIPASDPRVSFIQTLSEKELKDVGLEKYKGEGDKEFYKYIPPTVTDEEVKQSLSSSSSMKQIIDRAAAKNNIDPRIMYGIVRGESVGKMSGEYDVGDNRQSFGPFQMYMGGGLGNNFQRDTGLDPRNMSTLPQQADWIAKEIAKRGGGDAARRWVASQWYGYGTQQLGQPGTPRNVNERAALGDSNWNPGWFKTGVYAKMAPSVDPITQDYSKEQMTAEREKLVSEINAKRMDNLQRFSNAGLPVPGSPEAQQFFSDGRSEAAVRKRISELTGMESKECVALAKAYVGATGSVHDWRRGSSVLDGNLRPGTPIATFMDREGNLSEYYDGGKGVGKRGNDTTHAAVFLGYERDQSGKITGIRVADQWATSGGVRYRTYPIEGNSRITSAKNFYAINDPKGEPLGESNPMRAIQQAEQHQGGPKTETAAMPKDGPSPEPKSGLKINDLSGQMNFDFGSISQRKAFIIHHTGGRGDVEGVMNTFKERGFPAHYVIDRDGNVFRTLPEGAQGRHIRDSDGRSGTKLGESLKLNNSNTEGVEIIAKDDSDVTAAQKRAAAQLASKLGYNKNNIYGHGEINAHKQETEGSTVVGSIRRGEMDDIFAPKKEDVRPAPTGQNRLDTPNKQTLEYNLMHQSPDAEQGVSRPAPTGQNKPGQPGKETLEHNLMHQSPDAEQGVSRPAPRGEQTLGTVNTKVTEPPKAPESTSVKYRFDEAAFVAEVRAKEFGAALVSDEYILNELRTGFKNTPGVSYKNGVLTVNDPKSPAIQQVLNDMKTHNFDSSKFLSQIKEKKAAPKQEVKPVQETAAPAAPKPVQETPAAAPKQEVRPVRETAAPSTTKPVQETPAAAPMAEKTKATPAPSESKNFSVQSVSSSAPSTEPLNTKSITEQTNNPTVTKPESDTKTYDVAPNPTSDQFPTPSVKTNSKGGENKVDTDQISAMPIGGIKDDNSVVVNANERPLFTMNTDKESAVYNPTERKVDVIPKSSEVGKKPAENNMQSEIDGLRSDIMSLKEDKQQPGPKDITKGSKSHISDRDTNMIETIMDMTKRTFLDPSAARAFSRARFQETGDATNDFHHSVGNSNMKG